MSGCKEAILASSEYLDGKEFTSVRAHEFMRKGANIASTRSCLTRMVEQGILEQRKANDSSGHVINLWKRCEKSEIMEPAISGPTIEDRILASKVYQSGHQFTSAVLQAYIKGASKGGINFAINKLMKNGDIVFVRKATSGRGVNENTYQKASNSSAWLKMAWVSEPSPSVPAYC